jgi:lipopolysaccharide/colanic/teichoic acid biosynthesis glycosyltransferase
MIRKHARLSRQFAITLDAFTVILAFVISFYIRRALIFLIPFGLRVSLSDYALLMVIIPIIWWTLLNIQDAYTWQRFTSLWAEYKRVLKTTISGTLILTLLAFIFRLQKLPRSLIGIFAFVVFLMLILEKTLLYYMMGQLRKRGFNRKKALIVGTGELAHEFMEKTDKYPEWGLEVIGFLTDKSDEIGRDIDLGKVPISIKLPETDKYITKIESSSFFFQKPVLGSYDDLMKILHEMPVEEVVLALPSKDLDAAHAMLRLCEEEGIQVRLVSDFFRTIIAKFHVNEIYGMPILTFSAAPMKEWQLFVKRLLDVIISAIALIILSPLFLIIIFLIKITSPGPAFYEWKVVGYNRKPFKGYKFRSMLKDADKLKEKLLEHNEMNGPVFKMKNDPRITFIGRFLRKFSLDELPQLWSVFKGDMSIVGPRPCLRTELPYFENWHRRKFSVKPGLTCLWQVNGRSNIRDFDEWAKMDLEYIDNWSLWLDFKIMLKTFYTVFSGEGAQ